MQIICPNCQAEYDLDPPAAPFARDQDLVFRCTACATAIPLRLNEPALSSGAEEDPETDLAEAPPRVESFILLRQGGSTYRVENTAQLQRWIAERRIWPEDEVAMDGGEWQRVGDIEAYSVFFRLVEDAERVRGGADSPRESANTTSSPSPPMKPRPSGGAKSGLFAKPAHLDVSSDARPEEPLAEAGEVSAHTSTDEVQMVSDLGSPQAADDVLAPVAVDPVVEAEAEETRDPPSASVEEVHEQFGEVVPEEEAGAPLPPVSSTLDMEFQESGFFSEDQAGNSLNAGGGFDDDDDLLEWGQQRRKNMIMWWLMFFGALGGAAYLALDFLNARDAQQQPAAVDVAPEAETEAAPTAAPETAAVDDAGGDSGAEAADAGDGEGGEGNAPSEETEEEVEAPAAAPAPAPTPEESKPAAPPPPKKPSASTEIARGWAQIDRENWPKAREHFDSALRLSPSNSEARFGVAYVNEQQGRVGEAIAQYCRLSAVASGDAKIEAEGRLRALAKDCP